MQLKSTRRYIEALTTALSEDGIKFVEGKEWKTDVKNRVIMYDPLELQEMPSLVSKGLILHEVAHVKHTTTEEVKSVVGKKYPKAMKYIYNALEDMRIEKLILKEYGDFAKQAIGELVLSQGDLYIDETNKNKFHERPKLMQYFLKALAKNNATRFYSSAYYTDDAFLCRYSDNLDTYLGYDLLPVVNQRLNDTNYTDIIKKALKANDSQEIMVLGDSLFEPLKDFIEEFEKEMPPPPCGVSLMREIAKTLEGSTTGDPIRDQAVIPPDEDLKHILSPYINTLTQKLRDVLKERKSIRWNGSYKSGKLLSKNAFKIIAGEHRVFSKRNNPDTPHYAVTFLLDGSGSMRGERHANTYVASFLIDQVCKKLAFEIKHIGFESSPRLLKNLSGYRKIRGGGNMEITALEMALKHTDKTNDNLVFLMTDGMCGQSPKPITDKMRRDGYTVIAIAIGLEGTETQSIKSYYDDVIAVKQVEALPMAMIELMKRIVHR